MAQKTAPPLSSASGYLPTYQDHVDNI